MNCNRQTDLLTIPRGNPFRLHVCRANVAPANPEGVTFADIEGLRAFVSTPLGMKTEAETEVADDGDLIVTCPATLRITTYALELTGAYNAHPWRWKCGAAFRIADTNCESSVQGMESFEPDTYFLWDVVDLSFEGDAVAFASEGHVCFEGDALVLQDTEDTAFGFEGDAIVVTDNNKQIPSCHRM